MDTASPTPVADPAPKRSKGATHYILRAGGIVALLVCAGLFWLRGTAAISTIVIVASVYFVFWMLLSSGGIRALLIALAVALPFRWGIGEPYKIPSGSMEPTLHGDERPFYGDRVFVNKFIYGWRWPFDRSRVPVLGMIIDYADQRMWYGKDPARFDIVVFKSPEPDPRNMTLIKRVIGLPGERVHIDTGRIYINGEPLEMPPDLAGVYYTKPSSFSEPAYYGIRDEDEYAVVPEGHYLVLGDNSGNSRDGRFWGWVPQENILGRATCIWWPPKRMRDFTGFTQSFGWWAFVVLLLSYVVWRAFIGRSWRVGKIPLIRAVQPHEHVYIDLIALGLAIPLTSLYIYRKLPQRGDALLYLVADEDESVDGIMGWVAGLPGDEVAVDGATVTVNGTPLLGQFGQPPENAPFGVEPDKLHVPDGHLFLVCDTDGGPDSRSMGWVPAANAIGVVRAVWWPLGRRRRIRP